jgi:hypothetical protein
MNTLGVERRFDRAGWLGPRIAVRGPLIVLLAGATFACSFGLAHVLRAGTVSRAEAAPILPVANVSAALPARLASVAPLGAVPAPPPPAPRPRSSGGTSGTAVTPSVAAPSESAAAAPSSESGSRAATPTVETPAPSPAPPSSSSGGTSHHAPSSSGGGSFESSG